MNKNVYLIKSKTEKAKSIKRKGNGNIMATFKKLYVIIVYEICKVPNSIESKSSRGNCDTNKTKWIMPSKQMNRSKIRLTKKKEQLTIRRIRQIRSKIMFIHFN